MRIATVLFVPAALLGACGGASSPNLGGDASTDGGTNASCPSTQPAPESACSPSGLECSYTANTACDGYWVCTGGAWRREFPGAACEIEAGGNCHGTSGVIHRAEAAACKSNAGADAGCNIQPHDQCLTDSDCGAGQVCLCETPPQPGSVCPGGVGLPAGNVCVPANCHVDTDCGSCGVCQADYACGAISGFYCQTPTDPCFPASTSYDGNGCHFTAGQWKSAGPVACPG